MNRRTLLAGIATLAAARSAVAQATWAPDRPIRLVVPFAPGGSTDVTARLVAEVIAPRLGQPVVIENRPGAGGNIGTVAVARSAPDGYTFLMHSVAYSVNPSLYANAGYQVGKELVGVAINRAESAGAPGRWRVFPKDPIAGMRDLRKGTQVNRNRDMDWVRTLEKKSSDRRIGLWATLSETADGFALTLTDSDGIAATATLVLDRQPAKQPDTAADALKAQLCRLGGTDFQLREFTVTWTQPWFVPSSAANQLRRDAVTALEAARHTAYQRPLRRPSIEPPSPYPDTTLSYLANVYNVAARRFYEKHGVQLIAAAYEAHDETGEVSLMITKHCLRHAFNLCPHQAKGVTGVQGQVRAEPMTLINGNEKLTLTFDCRACEMHVMGRIKKHILEGAAS